jgi:Cytochrome c, mono- and diheme variants
MRRARLSLAFLLGLLAGPLQADEALFSPAEFARADGEAVYVHVCQGCHMADGKGAAEVGHYPGFVDNPTLVSPQYVALVVMNGRRNMPAFGLPPAQSAVLRGISLSDAQIAAVTNYLRSHFGNRYSDTLSAADVAALRSAK